MIKIFGGEGGEGWSGMEGFRERCLKWSGEGWGQ